MASSRSPGPVVALAGGVGAARFLRGLVACIAAEDIVVVVNTGDDREFYGVHVSPDLDIVTYTLAGRVHPERGYGLEGDTFSVVDALGTLGHETWFRLGDRDFATSLHRTLRLRAGIGLAAVTDEIRRAFGVDVTLLPMSEQPCPTLVELEDGRVVHFEEYLARDGAPDEVRGVDLSAARRAGLAPGVGEALRSARAVLVCPSNPVVSIGPVLAVPGVRQAIAASGAPVVAVTPIVGGMPVKGPADRLLRGIGVEVSARGVAGMYRGFAHGFVLDQRDAEQEKDVAALGLATAVVDTIMREPATAAALAESALRLAGAVA
ncbi:MAG TPA: 2-phospho-L-lactate transferase [Myxococcota bacterium]|nr:2-phospho-L-lactate transferase [Myxococcota bacterium]